jgi:hypothetical protein
MVTFRWQEPKGAVTEMEQQSYTGILRRAGFVLVAVGMVDIGWMIYCIVNGISYSSSLNIFTVIAGILLIRGGLKTAGLVRWLCIFFVSAFLSVALLFPLLQPVGLTIAEIRFKTVGVVTGVFFAVVIVAALYWVARELGRESILVAREGAGLKRGSARVPIFCGIGAVVVGAVALAVFLGGESADRARRAAAEQLGPGFALHVTSLMINESGRHKSVSAVVAAWNDKEVRDIWVHWEEGN